MSGTPDALRLSRLDRLISQLGEHQLQVRQQASVASKGLPLPSCPGAHATCSLLAGHVGHRLGFQTHRARAAGGRRPSSALAAACECPACCRHRHRRCCVWHQLAGTTPPPACPALVSQCNGCNPSFTKHYNMNPISTAGSGCTGGADCRPGFHRQAVQAGCAAGQGPRGA